MSLDKSIISKAIIPARKRIEENLIDRSMGILYFDKDNAFPQRCRGYINSSGTGKQCVEKFESYLYGNGFRDPLFSEQRINKSGQTADDLLAAICQDMAYHLGFYVHINYNALYEKISLKLIPFENVRYVVPEDDSTRITKVAIFDDWAKKKNRFTIDRDSIDIIDLYNPDPEEIQRQVEAAGGWNSYKGQVYANPLGYCLPIYDCIQEDLITDAGIKTFKLSTVESGFAASFIYIHKGKKPKGDETNPVEESLEEMQDPEAAGSILVIYAEKEDQVPELKKIEKDYDEKLHTVIRKTTKEDIYGAFNTPLGLVMQTPGKLGTPEYNEAVEIYNYDTSKYRLRLERAFKELFKNSVFKVKKETSGVIVQDFSIQPVGGIQTGLGIKETLFPHFITLMGNAQIPPPVKYATLLRVFGLSEDIAKELVPDANGPADN